MIVSFPIFLSVSHTHKICDKAGPVLKLSIETEFLITGQKELGAGAHKHCFVSKKNPEWVYKCYKEDCSLVGKDGGGFIDLDTVETGGNWHHFLKWGKTFWRKQGFCHCVYLWKIIYHLTAVLFPCFLGMILVTVFYVTLRLEQIWLALLASSLRVSLSLAFDPRYWCHHCLGHLVPVSFLVLLSYCRTLQWFPGILRMNSSCLNTA